MHRGDQGKFYNKKFFFKIFMQLDSPSKIKLRLLIAKFEETLVSKVTTWQSSKNHRGTKANFSEKNFFLNSQKYFLVCFLCTKNLLCISRIYLSRNSYGLGKAPLRGACLSHELRLRYIDVTNKRQVTIFFLKRCLSLSLSLQLY